VEIRHLRYVVAVAEEGSFTRAAARLHVAQQALSQQIADLERELRVRLFERSARGVIPTAAGLQVVEDARAALALVERTADRVRQTAAHGAPTLRIGAGRSFRTPNEIIAEAVTRFHGEEPGVEIELLEMPAALQLDALGKGRIDVAFGHAPPDGVSMLDGTQLWEESWSAVLLPARHRLASRSPLWLRDLAELPMITFPQDINPALLNRTLTLLGQRGLKPTIARIRPAQFPELAAELVAAGMGWRLMVPSARAEFRGVPGVAFRCFADEPIPRLAFWVLWRRDDPSPLVQRFAAVAAGCCRLPGDAARPLRPAG